MDIKFIKELGHGVEGTVYLIESDKKQYIYKIEKYGRYNPRDAILAHPYWRQVDFDFTVAQKHPDKFMTLKSHGILNGCEHDQPIPDFITGKFRKNLIEKNKSTMCYFLIYSPVLKHTWKDFMAASPSRKKYYSALRQIIDQINIMKKAGFQHGDIHPGNVMGGSKGDSKGFRLIDYGMVLHEKYPTNEKKRDESADLMMVLFNLAIRNPAGDYMMEKGIRWAPFATFLKRIEKHPDIVQMKKTVPVGLPKKIALDALAFVVCVSDYEFYKACIGATDKKFAKMTMTPIDTDLLLFCVRNLRNYPAILRRLDKLIAGA